MCDRCDAEVTQTDMRLTEATRTYEAAWWRERERLRLRAAARNARRLAARIAQATRRVVGAVCDV